MPAVSMIHTVDPKEKLLKEVGDLSNVDVFNNQVLVAVYMRPEKTSGGIILPGQNLDEDKYQSKVGLIVKKGPSAFVDEDNKWFADANLQEHDWVVFRPSESWSITVNKVLCRMIEDIHIKGRIDHPDRVW